MRRTPLIHQRQLPGEQSASDNQLDIKKNFQMTTGGGKSLGQKALRPQPQSFHASVKIQGGGMTCCHPLKR